MIVSNKKVIEVGKKNLFYSKIILSTFFLTLTFQQHQRGAVVAAVNLI